ncbi:hypothetical protein AX17_006183 [Amanita inopinata Kibby_2008]|nr:hypothetical protein AX17_006183 [Amanita inopinata Kibby_2008]
MLLEGKKRNPSRSSQGRSLSSKRIKACYRSVDTEHCAESPESQLEYIDPTTDIASEHRQLQVERLEVDQPLNEDQLETLIGLKKQEILARIKEGQPSNLYIRWGNNETSSSYEAQIITMAKNAVMSKLRNGVSPEVLFNRMNPFKAAQASYESRERPQYTAETNTVPVDQQIESRRSNFDVQTLLLILDSMRTLSTMERIKDTSHLDREARNQASR